MCRLLVQAQQRGNRGEVGREIDVVSTWHVRPAPPRSAETFATRSGSGPGPGRDGVAGLHEIAPVCQVDDAVGVGCRLPDDVQVVEVAVADLGAAASSFCADVSERARAIAWCPAACARE